MNRFSADTLFLDHCSGGHTARQQQGFRTIIAAPISALVDDFLPLTEDFILSQRQEFVLI
ncbi:hypothetical protein ACFOJE_13710 [Azotobacter bryophylli]|uniref:Uncharacterized protein n=1 Tax=Azotobacter bryophylli TaxID=1986537 RepID=A0ABV7AWH8_9GAMM